MREKARTAIVLAMRFLFLTRCSWLLALLLVALPPFSLAVAPALLENLFILDRPIQLFHISWISMFCSASVIGTLRIAALNAADRFEDYRQACLEFQRAWGQPSGASQPWFRRWDGWLTLVIGLAAVISIWFVFMAACITRTAADPSPEWVTTVRGPISSVAVERAAWIEAAKGAGMTLGVLGAIYCSLAAHQVWFAEQASSHCAFRGRKGVLQRETAILDQSPTADDDPFEHGWLHPIYSGLAWLLGPGYFREVTYAREDGNHRRIVLAPGHGSLILSTLLFLSWYVWNYGSVLRDGKMPDESSALPALFFGLLSLLLVILILPGLSFLLDRHRVPILPTLLLVMAACYSVFRTDHYFELHPTGKPVAQSVSLPLERVYDNWELPRGVGGQRTLVVVDASGGGIQASAWTAQVLTGLHEIYGDAFSRSVGLISAVSGGSVGSMFYLVNRAEVETKLQSEYPNSVLPPESIARIRDAARASGLEASCWGIAYPDTMRALFPPLAGPTIDRGWSIEQIWRERMRLARSHTADWRLNELAELVHQRQLPAVVFNSTLVETGQRLVISPVLGPPTAGDTTNTAREFLREFPDSNLRVSTAARLSATFPYVTPVARPLETGTAHTTSVTPLRTFHVADGAYADNEGVVTSVDWINRLLVHYSKLDQLEARPFDRVLLVRIQAFPRQTPHQAKAAGSLAGWRAALLGPFDTMMRVRSASQTERGDLEINLLTRATLAELKAARERAEREFQSAIAQIEQLEAIREEIRGLSTLSGASAADQARRFLEIEDQLHSAELMLRRAQEHSRLVTELHVESVIFDFQPVDQVQLPMSWKLTTKQKRQIDNSWQALVAGQLPLKPLEVLDRYFPRHGPSTPRIAAH